MRLDAGPGHRRGKVLPKLKKTPPVKPEAFLRIQVYLEKCTQAFNTRPSRVKNSWAGWTMKANCMGVMTAA